MTQSSRGFTLIELLVVIAIIGMLSSVVLASLNSARTKAAYAAAQAELRQISQAMVLAQGETGQALLNMTGSGCSRCACGTGNLKNIAESSACYQNWSNAITAIENAGGGVASGISNATRDPWGSPYLLDENELEFASNPCRNDNVRTAGEDGVVNTSDDFIVTIPFGTAQCS